MTTTNKDLVAEYLHEVDARLAGLPVLRRRELLADLTAHIAAERAERDITDESQLIELLERLGTPDEVADAAFQETGVERPAKATRRKFPWVPVVIAAVVVIVLVFCGVFGFATDRGKVSPGPGTTMVVPQPS